MFKGGYRGGKGGIAPPHDIYLANIFLWNFFI